VVVTGAARGIGLAIAARFAADGHRVVGIDLDGDALRAAMGSLAVPGAAEPAAVVGDVRDEDLLEHACELAAAGGGLHAFVANAGVAQPGDSLDYPVEAWDRLMSVHATAAFLGARCAARRMPGGGSVVVISSVNGHLGFAGRAAYCAAKAAVQGLVRSLAVEWAPRGIRVNAVSPGSIATELQAEFLRTGFVSPQLYLSRIPMGRYGRPEEIADAVHYLCSVRASYITGVVLPVDGGWLANGLPVPEPAAEPAAASL
jgi:NAD(P)-dependent dehydrogenase (short-subunit alcohol dehydrogenase family)